MSLNLIGIFDPINSFGTPIGSKFLSKWLFKFFLSLIFAAKYQSCHPWYPEKAIFVFLFLALAILIAIATASPPDLENFTWSAKVSIFKSSFARLTSSKEFKVVFTPCEIFFLIKLSNSSFA